MERKNAKTSENNEPFMTNAEENNTRTENPAEMINGSSQDDLMLKAIEALLKDESSVVILKGNAGRDAEHVPNTDGKFARFSLAVNHYKANFNGNYGSAGDNTRETDWYNIEVRRDQVARTVNEVKKGCKLTMIGKLRKVKYLNKSGQQVNDAKVIMTGFWAQAS